MTTRTTNINSDGVYIHVETVFKLWLDNSNFSLGDSSFLLLYPTEKKVPNLIYTDEVKTELERTIRYFKVHYK